MISPQTHTVVHVEEFYLEMDYKTPYPYFHTFAGEVRTMHFSRRRYEIVGGFPVRKKMLDELTF